MPSVPQAYQAFHPDGSLKDEKLERRLKSLGVELVKTIERHCACMNKEFGGGVLHAYTKHGRLFGKHL